MPRSRSSKKAKVAAYRCNPCGNEFSSQKGLNSHRKACSELAQADEITLVRIRQLEREDAKKRKREAKALKRNTRLSSEALNSTAESSTNPSQSADLPPMMEMDLDNDGVGLGDGDYPMHKAPPLAPAPTVGGRPFRNVRFPEFKFRDYVPSLRSALSHIPQPIQHLPPVVQVQAPEIPLPPPTPPPPPPLVPIETEPNDFGVFRIYPTPPSSIPEETQTLDDINDAFQHQSAHTRSAVPIASLSIPSPASSDEPYYSPFSSPTAYRIIKWMLNDSSSKSIEQVDSLVQDVLLAQDFDVADLKSFSVKQELKRLDRHVNSPSKVLRESEGWRCSTLKVYAPCKGEKAVKISVPGFYHRRLVDIVDEAVRDPASINFHYTPYKHMWRQTSTSPPQRLYGEYHTSDFWLREHEKLQRRRPAGDTLEYVIYPLGFYSDGTRLATFGNASLWPIYLFFALQTKYERGQPSSGAYRHVAYIPSLPADYTDQYRAEFDTEPNEEVKKFSKRELFQAVWATLLDDDFVDRYENGFVATCADGVTRRLFLRIATYSADLPEKVNVATTKQLALYTCPCCLVKKQQLCQLGYMIDMARRENAKRIDCDTRQFDAANARSYILNGTYVVNSKKFDDMLYNGSLVPISNAFSDRLFKLGFDFFQMVVPDLMHEFELGVWKAAFTHLIRLATATGPSAVAKINKRYRSIPTFGRDTIRKITTDISDMKQLAARDFEDLLQCAMPVFEDIFSGEDNKIVLDYLHTLALWHAYAKLRLHTETTLEQLNMATKTLGQIARRFLAKVCSRYQTKELPKELRARQRRLGETVTAPAASSSNVRLKAYNLNTYKFHALGHYVAAIKMFGTTDSYSTQAGELEHRTAKRLYARTNKNKTTAQIANHERRRRLLRKMDDETDVEPIPRPSEHYSLSDSRRDTVNVYQWMHKNEGAHGAQNFLQGLKNHLLSRINASDDYAGLDLSFCAQDRDSLIIINDSIFRHKVLRLNHSTYDFRRDQDTINARTHADVLLLPRTDVDAVEDPYALPFQYARVIGIYHVFVRHSAPNATFEGSRRFDFLHVRWFRRDPRQRYSGLAAKRIDRLCFYPVNDPGAYGFLDPDLVVRGAHLIPAFAHGETKHAHRTVLGGKETEWTYYYAMPFVDRDMFMRYAGGGVGHGSYRLIESDAVEDIPDEEFHEDCRILDQLDADGRSVGLDKINEEGYDSEEFESEEESDIGSEIDEDEDDSHFDDDNN